MAHGINRKKKVDIQKHHLPSCSIFPGLLNPFEFRDSALIFEQSLGFVLEIKGVQTGTKVSFVALRPSILPPLLINL